MLNPSFRRAFIALAGLLIGLTGCEKSSDHKIRLATGAALPADSLQGASSVLRVAPEEQRSVAILYFHNETNDSSLDWLERGLTDMLFTELSQSPFLNVVPVKQLNLLSKKMGYPLQDIAEVPMARAIARAAGAELFFTGRFYRRSDNLAIDVKIFDIENSRPAYQETVNGAGMEQIFQMVDDLSGKVRANLRDKTHLEPPSDRQLANMTNSVDAFRCYSEALMNAEKFLYADAAECLRDAIDLDTTFAAAYLQLAMLNLNHGKRKEAASELKMAKKYRHKLSRTDKIYLKLSQARMAGNYDRLLPILEEAVRNIPGDADLRFELARYYHMNLGKLEKALTEYEKVVELNPDRKMVYNQLGYLFAQRGDFTTALKNLDRYQELAPNEPNPYDSRGEILMMAGRFSEAEVQLKTALEKGPTFDYSATRLVTLYIETGDYKSARNYLRLLEESKSENNFEFDIEYNRVMLYWREGDRANLKRALKKFAKKYPSYNNVALLEGEIYHNLGEPALAAAAYGRLMKQFKQNIREGKIDPAYVNNLILFMMRIKTDPSEALSILNQLKEYPNPIEVKSAIEFGRSVFHLRNNQRAEAQNIFTQYGDTLIYRLTVDGLKGWGNLWQYIFETVRRDNARNALAFSRELIKAAKKSGRKDFLALAYLIQAISFEKSGNREAFREAYRKIGMPRESQWNVVGPFRARNASNLHYRFPPEKKLKLDYGYEFQGKTFHFSAGGDGVNDGYINFSSLLPEHTWSAAYAQIFIHSPDNRQVQIRLGTDEACKVWLNNKLIWQHYMTGDAKMDRDLITVILHPGENNLMLKVTNTDFDWGFYLRVTDESGFGFRDIRFHSRPDEGEITSVARPVDG